MEAAEIIKQQQYIKLLKMAHIKVMELKDNVDLEAELSYESEFAVDLKQVRTVKNRPSEVSVKSAITDIRHFMMDESPIQFTKVARILYEYSNEEERMALKKTRDAWYETIGLRGNKAFGGLVIEMPDGQLTRKKLIDRYFNGDVMHLDELKFDELQDMKSGPLSGFIEMIFIMVIQDIYQILYYLDKYHFTRVIEQMQKK